MKYFFIILSVIGCVVSAYAQSDKMEIIINPSDSLSNVKFITMPSFGIGAIIEGTIYFLEEQQSNNIDRIILSKERSVDGLIFDGTEILYKSGQSIYAYNNGEETHVMSFDTDSFQLTSGNADYFYLFSQHDDYSVLFQCSKNSKKTELLLDFPEAIRGVFGDTECLFILADNHIYIANKDYFDCILDFPETILSAASTPYGTIFSTDNQSYILYGQNEFFPFADFGCKQILYDNDFAYLMTIDNYLLKLNLKSFFSSK